MDFTFGSLMTDEGRVKMYLGQGRFTADPLPDNFFGVAGVAEIRNLPGCTAPHRQYRAPASRQHHTGRCAGAGRACAWRIIWISK